MLPGAVACRDRHAGRGGGDATVVTLDEYGTAVYLIEQGEADVMTVDSPEPLALGPGDASGEIALLLTGQRTATVVARTRMRLLSLAGLDFERIRERVPEVERALRRLADAYGVTDTDGSRPDCWGYIAAYGWEQDDGLGIDRFR